MLAFIWDQNIYGETGRDKIRINLKLQLEHQLNPQVIIKNLIYFQKKKMFLTQFLWSFQVQPALKQEHKIESTTGKDIKGQCQSFPGVNLMEVSEPNGKSKC